MHKYIKAIGFQTVSSEKQWNQILRHGEDNFTGYELISLEEGLDFCELKKEYGIDIGICSYGQIDENERFEREYYVPYFIGSGITSHADVTVEKRSDRESYVGICEDAKVGVTLIFHLINGMEIRKEMERGDISRYSASITLSGLANEGTVLLPILKNQEQEERRREESRNRMMLLSAAREGDSEAIENLTLDDIDIYTQVTKRLEHEDIFSIVDTYFMPCGVECDHYSVLGEILDIDILENSLTGEEVYVLTLDINELTFDVCVPVKSLTGEPEIGRRFKGDIWLQGQINF